MEHVERHFLWKHSYEVVAGNPEVVPVARLAAEIAWLLVRGRPYPPRAVLDEVFARRSAEGTPVSRLASGTPSERGVCWRPLRLDDEAHEALRLACLTDPALGLAAEAPPPGLDTFAAWVAFVRPDPPHPA